MDKMFPGSEILESTARKLSKSGDDALTKADLEGYPEWDEVVVWTEQIKNLVLNQRSESDLQAELTSIIETLLRFLEDVSLSRDSTPRTVCESLLVSLPIIRASLSEDIEAAFEGDPAAKTFAEIVISYPSIAALAVHRIAHVLYEEGVAQIPRIMSEHAHSRTGIDIHPGAKIGHRFFIDHGTGVVIGETSKIGDNVRIYHGVTLGAFSPRRGQRQRGIRRHPTIESNVTIYPGATVLGGGTVIGEGSVINGNAYVVSSVPPNSRVVPKAPDQEIRLHRELKTGEQLDWDI